MGKTQTFFPVDLRSSLEFRGVDIKIPPPKWCFINVDIAFESLTSYYSKKKMIASKSINTTLTMKDNGYHKISSIINFVDRYLKIQNKIEMIVLKVAK